MKTALRITFFILWFCLSLFAIITPWTIDITVLHKLAYTAIGLLNLIGIAANFTLIYNFQKEMEDNV